MGILLSSEERRENRKLKGLGFPYPVKKRKNKTNLIGDIPLNQLSPVDFTSVQVNAPIEIRDQIQPDRAQTYYEIRDVYLIKKQFHANAREPGLMSFAFFFGDYLVEVFSCQSKDSAKDRAINLSIKHGEPVIRVYKQNASMKWVRVRGLI